MAAAAGTVRQMRIFWPSTVQLPDEGGIAIGWRKGSSGDVLRVAAVVPAWRNEFNLLDSRLTILAKVQDIRQLPDSDPGISGSDLMIYLEDNRPAALSVRPSSGPASVVIYTPASSVADLLIQENEGTDEGDSSPADDDVMDAFVQSTKMQRFIFDNTIPKRRSWPWLAVRTAILANHVSRPLQPMLRPSTWHKHPGAARPGELRLPRWTWRTSKEFKAATKMPLPRVRRHGFEYRPGLPDSDGGGGWSDLTLEQVLPIVFVLLFIFRRYWLPLVWQAGLAIMVIVAWVLYEVGIGLLKGIVMLTGHFDFLNTMWTRVWCVLANARQWSAAVDAVCFIWALASTGVRVREDSLVYKQNVLRLNVEASIGPILGGLLLRMLPVLRSLSVVLVDPVIAAIDWLNSWPVGFKLNTELSNFMASTLKAALNLWKDWVFPQLSVPYILVFLLVASTPAALGFLAHALDAFRLNTLHLRAGYLFTRALFRWQMSALGGLWNLFRGKRWNTLRHRTDSHAYDVDTLFLGTLLFTLSVFLAPTLIAYYGLFALINLALTAVEGLFRVGIACGKTCPWYELQLRFRFPDALPGGVVFEPVPLPAVPADNVYPVQQMLKANIIPKSYGEILAPMRESVRQTLISLKSRL